MSGISTHVLNITDGKPAAGIPVMLERREEGSWDLLFKGATDTDGRCRDCLGGIPLKAGEYRFIFETNLYFAARQIPALYPEIVIAFYVREPDQHHHIPLLLAPNGYTTYRGS